MNNRIIPNRRLAGSVISPPVVPTRTIAYVDAFKFQPPVPFSNEQVAAIRECVDTLDPEGKIRLHFGNYRKATVKILQPTPAEMVALQAMLPSGTKAVSAELAFDYVGPPELDDFLRESLAFFPPGLKKPPYPQHYKNPKTKEPTKTIYFRRRGSAFNLAYYSDRPCKRHPELGCVPHVEYRLNTAEILAENGFIRPSDFLSPARDFLQRHLRLVRSDIRSLFPGQDALREHGDAAECYDTKLFLPPKRSFLFPDAPAPTPVAELEKKGGRRRQGEEFATRTTRKMQNLLQPMLPPSLFEASPSGGRPRVSWTKLIDGVLQLTQGVFCDDLRIPKATVYRFIADCHEAHVGKKIEQAGLHRRYPSLTPLIEML